jgi:sugar lactone lactonase YvrE
LFGENIFTFILHPAKSLIMIIEIFNNYLKKHLIKISGIILLSCNTTHNIVKSQVPAINQEKIAYDDSALVQTSPPYLLPYNRIIDGAGTMVSFGRDILENHSLDAVLLPDNKTLAVEDRYGVAFINVRSKKIVYRLAYDRVNTSPGTMSVYSGIKVLVRDKMPHIFWSASDHLKSFILEATWDGKEASITDSYYFDAVSPYPLALANDLQVQNENGEDYMYVVLNGTNQLVKMHLSDKKMIWQTNTGMAPYGIAITGSKAYVTNWAGPVPTDSTRETAGVPYGHVYINHATGATSIGTVSIIDIISGRLIKEIEVGHHPNDIIASSSGNYVYVANGNSDNVSVIVTSGDTLGGNISVKLNGAGDDFLGDSPNALGLSDDDNTLYVANGLDNAVAVISLHKNDNANGSTLGTLKGFIPTQAYPGGIVINGNQLYVTNLEGIGARVKYEGAFNSHLQEAVVSFIDLPGDKELADYTVKVKRLNLQFRNVLTKLLPRQNVKPRPVPERIGEPSSIKHIVYIIKENRTYDQVLGDMPEGRGDTSYCVFGDSITPNQHAMALQYGLLDNYYASGKSSAEGHQWTDAAMVNDYVEKSVRAWFRSYPHVQQDALVYSDAGFIWNNALDHGKTVRIYGEACVPLLDPQQNWTDIYNLYLGKKQFYFRNVTTISRVEPIMSKSYPCYDSHRITDQLRADAFITEWKNFEQSTMDSLPDLMIMALPDDHTAGMEPGFPTPRAAVADNDLALGRIVDAITHSKYWDSTAIFVTEDDSQDGWDHISAYRTTCFIISPFSIAQKVMHTDYNQTCMVRTIEQILGIPPMNKIDATATPMFECFDSITRATPYHFRPNRIPLDEMNKGLSFLNGKARKFAELSMQKQFEHIDGGNDDLLNRIIWYATMGDKKYPVKMTLGNKDED